MVLTYCEPPKTDRSHMTKCRVEEDNYLGIKKVKKVFRVFKCPGFDQMTTQTFSVLEFLGVDFQ